MARKTLNDSLQPALIAALAALGGAVFVAFVLAQIVVRPIHVIRSGLSRLGKGDLAATLDLKGDEFKDLGDIFASLTNQLKAAIPDSAKRGQLVELSRRVTALVPAFGPFSRVVLLLVGAVAAGTMAGLFIVFRKLDYQALNLASLVVPALLPVLALVLGMLFYGPLAGVRQRIPQRGVIALIGFVLAAALPVLGLRKPTEDTGAAALYRPELADVPLSRRPRGRLTLSPDGTACVTAAAA